MKNFAYALCIGLLFSLKPAFAGPAEEASALVDQWSATYNSNDRNALVKLYAPDALLFGTNSKIATRGTDGIRDYFVALDNGDRRNTIIDKTVFVLNDSAVVVAGFYDFSRKDPNYKPVPARYTMLIVKQGGKWLIEHHHSSPRGAPAP